MATGAAPFSLSGATHVKACEPWSAKSSSFVKTPMVTIQRKSNSQGTKTSKLSIRANYRRDKIFGDLQVPNGLHSRQDQSFLFYPHSDQRGGGGHGGDFVAGFLLGGAIFGTLGYIFAPQIRRSLLNEDEYGFRKAKRPMYYYDEGLEKTRQTLNNKLDQLNSAIDKVSSGLRGGNKMPSVSVESDAEEATM
ncbi:hypothetical protein H5410_017319 [Solanum commersonii]|uniref:Uncharacterized protein n=1 Tax=Solanum commersonii TaxID=4109 RepID=A0A9J6A062_SOLCO|nr:hypothetical protein H5410_017319 [Solanum commersonii]